jgi:hypothetical protein
MCIGYLRGCAVARPKFGFWVTGTRALTLALTDKHERRPHGGVRLIWLALRNQLSHGTANRFGPADLGIGL